MAVFRVNKNKDYTTMSNKHLKDKKLSLKAKGLLSVMLSLPDSWDYSIEGLIAISKENRSSIRSTLNELKENHYLNIVKQYPNETQDGRFNYIYDIFEEPQNAHNDSDINENNDFDEKKQDTKKQGVENQHLEIQHLEIQDVENRTQLNTNILNTNILNTNNQVLKDIRKKVTFDDLIDAYTENDDLKKELKNHLATRKSKKATLTNRAIELSFRTLDDLVSEYPVNIQDDKRIQIVQQSIERGWTGFFPLKNNNEVLKGNPFLDMLGDMK